MRRSVKHQPPVPTAQWLAERVWLVAQPFPDQAEKDRALGEIVSDLGHIESLCDWVDREYLRQKCNETPVATEIFGILKPSNVKTRYKVFARIAKDLPTVEMICGWVSQGTLAEKLKSELLLW